MARQEQRTARKDYPENGIKKGDQYWFAQIKTGPRSSLTIRSLERIPESRLTTSPFKSGWYAMQEAWEASGQEGDDIRAAAEAIRELGQEAQNSFDNMPEGLQQGETGQKLENRVSECDRIADELDVLADRLEALEEPDPMDEPAEDDEEARTAFEEWQESVDAYEGEKGEINDEAGGLIGEMPE